jgi:uncharacterized protein (DUF433 family)
MLRKGISTSTIAERVDAGESVDDLAADYGLGASEIEQAVVYERAATVFTSAEPLRVR